MLIALPPTPADEDDKLQQRLRQLLARVQALAPKPRKPPVAENPPPTASQEAEEAPPAPIIAPMPLLPAPLIDDGKFLDKMRGAKKLGALKCVCRIPCGGVCLQPCVVQSASGQQGERARRANGAGALGGRGKQKGAGAASQ